MALSTDEADQIAIEKMRAYGAVLTIGEPGRCWTRWDDERAASGASPPSVETMVRLRRAGKIIDEPGPFAGTRSTVNLSKL